MALVFVGVSSGAVSLLGPLHTARPYILGFALVLLAVGWVVAIRRRNARLYPILGVASGLIVVALTWQIWDPILQKLVLQVAGR